jgi:hypothetical protein
MDGGDSPRVMLCRLLHDSGTAANEKELAPSQLDKGAGNRGTRHDHRSCPVCQAGSRPALLDIRSVEFASPDLIVARAEHLDPTKHLVHIRFAGAAFPRAPPSLA